MRWVMRATGLLLVVLGCTDDPADDGPDGVDSGTPDDDPTEAPFVAPPCDDTSLTPVTTPYAFVQEPIEGMEVLHFLPERPRAVVFAFHGGGGTVSHLLGLHYTRSWDILGEVDVGLVATDSADRASGSWDLSDGDGNVDMARMAQLRDHFVATGEMSEDTPIWAWGFSAGGAFTRTFVELGTAQGWPVRGALVHAASWGRTTEVPALFTAGVNDENVVGAEASYDAHVAADLEAAFFANEEHAWTPDTMVLDPGYTAEQSAAVHDELVALGFIDAAGARLAPLGGIDARFATYEGLSALPGPTRVTNQLRVSWAMHRVSSEFACEERDFVLADLGLL